MKHSYTFYIAILAISIFSWIGISAFQKPHPSDPEPVIPNTDTEIENKRLAAEHLVYDGDFDGCLNAYQALYQECVSRKLIDKSFIIFEEMLSIEAQNPYHDLKTKLAYLKNSYTKANTTDLLPFYQAGLAQLYGFNGILDSMAFYFELATKNYPPTAIQSKASLAAVLANCLYNLENFDMAKFYINKTTEIVENHLKPKGIVLKGYYNAVSSIYLALDEYPIALKNALADIAELEADKTTHIANLSEAYNKLATIYSEIGDYNHALNYYNKELDLLKNSENISPIHFATLYYNIGSTYIDMDKNELAKKYFFSSLNELKKDQELTDDILQDYINNYQQIASFYLNENIDSAEYYILKAKDCQKKLPYRIAQSKTTHARIFLSKKDFVNAKAEMMGALKDALSIYGNKHATVAIYYSRYAQIFLEEGNYREALVYIQKALETLSITFSDEKGVGNPKIEDVLFKTELSYILKIKLSMMQAALNSGTANFSQADFYKTARLATEALEITSRSLKNEESKRHWLNKEAIPTFETAIRIAIDGYTESKNFKYLDEAFILAERSKSMLMMEAMQEATAAAFGGVPDSLLQTEQMLQNKIDKATKLRFDANSAGNAIEAKRQDSLIFNYTHLLDNITHTYEQKYPQYYQLKYASFTASIKDIQNKLDDKTTFVEYFDGEQNFYIFTIYKNEAFVNIVPKEADFASTIYDFQKDLMDIGRFLSKPDVAYNSFVEISQKLYHKLLEKSLKPQTKRLIIIPDGQLGYFPFEVLLNKPVQTTGQKATDVNFAELPYLIRDFTVNYNYSGTLMLSQLNAPKQKNNGNILALAASYENKTAPEWRGQKEKEMRKHLIELPGAIAEVEKLQGLFGGNFYKGADANETIFKKEAPNYGILHLAMHGLVDKSSPEFSGLAMTEDNNKDEDNFLYAYEIKKLGLNANLVVLSACETGIGKYQRGEGVLSIGRGFMYAGAPALLMTLWSLNDQSGALIIEYFYKNLSEGLEKDEAIRQAKLKYLAQASPNAAHPFLWAPFIQVGDISAIPVETKSPWLLYMGGGLTLAALAFGGMKMRKNKTV